MICHALIPSLLLDYVGKKSHILANTIVAFPSASPI